MEAEGTRLAAAEGAAAAADSAGVAGPENPRIPVGTALPAATPVHLLLRPRRPGLYPCRSSYLCRMGFGGERVGVGCDRLLESRAAKREPDSAAALPALRMSLWYWDSVCWYCRARPEHPLGFSAAVEKTPLERTAPSYAPHHHCYY